MWIISRIVADWSALCNEDDDKGMFELEKKAPVLMAAVYVVMLAAVLIISMIDPAGFAK